MRFGSKKVMVPSPSHARAGAHRIVEREEPRLQLRQRIAADRARELRREQVLAAGVHLDRECAAIGVAQRGLEASASRCFASARAFSRSTTTSMVCFWFFASFGSASMSCTSPSMRSRTKPCARNSSKRSCCSPLRPDHQRRQDHEPRVLRQREHVVHHLRHRLRGERDAVLGAVRLADAGEEQPQVVVDFGDRADGGARVVAGRLLLDGDGGRQALDQVHVRLFHELQELPRVRRERSRHSAAGPRRRACRKRARTCRSPKAR